jgi:alpha-maltose-1-phosphate synthase
VKVAIATSGRFHVLDLARELDQLGVKTLFYSYVPSKRAVQFGLPKRCCRSLLPFVAPAVGWQAYAGRVLPNLQEKAMAHSLNGTVIARLAVCDFFICMSGIYLEAVKFARRHFGSRIWLERGSCHILSQDDILKAIPGAARPTSFTIERELEGYELADRIVVPSAHVAESFAEKSPHLSHKLFVNPYGVDLDRFPVREVPQGLPTVLFVGSWTYRKGVSELVEAISLIDNLRLLHVGSLGDAPFPRESAKFEHIGPVPQWRLKDFYAKAHVFVLPSHEEGLAMVLLQAAVSGVPIVCSDRTGGSDLRITSALKELIFVTPPGNVSALRDALSGALSTALSSNGFKTLSPEDRDLLSWRAYGKRYYDELYRDWQARR